MLGTNTYGNYKSSQELQELWKWNTQEKSVQGGAKVMVRGGERVVSKLERRGWVWTCNCSRYREVQKLWIWGDARAGGMGGERACGYGEMQ